MKLLLLIFCLIFTLQVSHVESACSQNFPDITLQNLGGRNYYFSTPDYNKLTWLEANNFCRSHDMELVNIETQEENNLVTEHAKTTGRKPISGGWLHYWLGGTDEGHEGQFTWTTTNQSLKFTAWYPHENEPNNANGNENCMAMVPNYEDGIKNWLDKKCDLNYYFICEQYCN